MAALSFSSRKPHESIKRMRERNKNETSKVIRERSDLFINYTTCYKIVLKWSLSAVYAVSGIAVLGHTAGKTNYAKYVKGLLNLVTIRKKSGSLPRGNVHGWRFQKKVGSFTKLSSLHLDWGTWQLIVWTSLAWTLKKQAKIELNAELCTEKSCLQATASQTGRMEERNNAWWTSLQCQSQMVQRIKN